MRTFGRNRSWHRSAASALVCLAACSGNDRLTLRFDDASARIETAAIDVYAVGLLTRSGATIGCDQLLAGSSRVDDGECVVAQHTEVAVPVLPAPKPLLVDLPQERYAFFAAARDRFGFGVAAGCSEGTVTAQSELDVVIRLLTLPAPSGRLEPADLTSWVQFAGTSGATAAIPPTIYAFDDAGNPLPGVEVRALVEAGNALALTPSFTTRLTEVEVGGFRGHVAEGHSQVLVGVGSNRILLHARGLRDSPVVFDIVGVASPEYIAETDAMLQADGSSYTPVALVAGNFDVDTDTADEMLALVEDGQQGYYCALSSGQWCSQLDISQLKQQQCVRTSAGQCDCSGSSLPYRPKLAVAGSFDFNDATDLAVATADTPPRWMMHFNSNDVLDTTPLGSGVPQYPARECYACACPSFTHGEVLASIDRLLVARIDDDELDDVLVEAQLDPATTSSPYTHRIYVCVSAGQEWCRTLGQTIIIPDSAGSSAPQGLDIVVGDLDGDGHGDLVLAPYDGPMQVFPWRPLDPQHGWYRPPAAVQLASVDGRKFIDIGDTSADPSTDLLAVSAGYLVGPALQVVAGDGHCADLTTVNWIALPLAQVDQALFGDFNADGRRDALAIANRAPQTALLVGSAGDGTFAQPLPFGIDMNVDAAAAADINGDGVPEVGMLGHTSDGALWLFERSIGLAR